MSLREVKFWYWIARHLPKKLRYFCIMQVWADTSTSIYIDKHPDEITWHMAVKTLGVE